MVGVAPRFYALRGFGISVSPGRQRIAKRILIASQDEMFTRGQITYCVPATSFLVETLLDRAEESDVAEAEAAIARLAVAPAEGCVIRDVWLLRMRALMVRARGDAIAYRGLRDRYRDIATSLGFEGHIQWSAAMA